MSPTSGAAAVRGWRRYVPHTRKQLALTAGGGVALFLLLVGIAYAATDIPSPKDISTRQTTLVYASDGRTVLGRIGALNRVSVPLEKVPVHVRHAVLAAEDRDFYSQPGISPTGIARALWANVRGGEVQQGGSTITQQYAKNAYLTQERTFTRKIKEIFIAVKLDRQRSKDQILEDYLNTIYFGRGAYGIQAASSAYFGKDVSKLSVSEGALLAAVISSPSYYDPAANPEAAKGRWQYVIRGMEKEGWLRDAQGQPEFPKVVAARQQAGSDGPNGFVVQAVKEELARHGFTENRLTLGGYAVVTTIDARAQRAAIDAEREILPPSAKGPLSAVVSVQPGNGAIRVMYGGADYGNQKYPKSFYNLAAAPWERQPGSSMKPYTLIAALQDGISLKSVWDGSSPQRWPWYPKPVSNSNGHQCPDCTLVDATAQSINTVYVPLAKDVGPENVVKAAHEAGVTSKDLDRVKGQVGISLGIANVSVLDQAVGYATIAAQGVRAAPYLVKTVVNGSGTKVYQADVRTERAFDKDVMADTTYALQKVLDCGANGTGCGKALAGRPAAGKTGTTEQNADAWFVGFTPQLATAVWIGMPDPNVPITGVTGYNEVYGGGPPAAIWKRVMDSALEGYPVMDFPAPVFLGDPNRGDRPTATPTTASPSPSATPSATASATPTPTKTKPNPKPSVTVSTTTSTSPTPVSSAPGGGGGGSGGPPGTG